MTVCFKYVDFERSIGHPCPDDHNAVWIEGSRALEHGLGYKSISGGYHHTGWK